MGHSRLKFLGMVGLALMLLAACGSSPAPAAKTYKIGLVTDTGGLNDKSFNHLADVGLEKAKTDFKVQGDVVESHSGGDYVPNLTHFATLKYRSERQELQPPRRRRPREGQDRLQGPG